MIDRNARLAAALLLIASAAGPAAGQATISTKPAAPRPANDDATVVATVDDVRITKGDVLKLLGQYTVTPGRDQEVYQAGVDAIVNRALLKLALDRENVAVSAAEIDQEIEKFRQQLKQTDGGDLTSALADMSLTPDEFRQQITLGLRWTKHLKSKATDQAQRDYFQKNIDLFTGAQVKASHILAKVDPDASEDVKQAARQKLVDLKKQIADKKITFAEAANKFSDDEGNKETPDGGNLDYFTKRGQYIDAFCDAAFALSVGEVSDPVETEYGFHLIMVTDKKAGQELTYDTEGVKEQIQELYGSELQQQVIDQTRKAVKVDVKPMPEGFFPPVAQPAAVPAPTATPGATKGAATPGTRPKQ